MSNPQDTRSEEEQDIKIYSFESFGPEEDACDDEEYDDNEEFDDNEESGDESLLPDYIIAFDGSWKERKFKVIKNVTLNETSYSSLDLVLLKSFGVIVAKKIQSYYINPNYIMDVDDLKKKLYHVRHPNIVRFFGVHTITPQIYWVCMEFMDISISDLLKKCYGNMEEDIKDFIPEDFIWYIVKPILSALSHLYDKLECYHGDLNATEVLLNRHGNVKLIAFNGTPIHPKHKILIKKLDTYIAPERFHDKPGKELDIRSDIWSLGVILYKLATGIIPFPNPLAQKLEDLQHYKKNASCPLENSSCQISPDLRKFITNCMEMEITKRPSLNDLMKSCNEVPGYDAAKFIEKYIKLFLEIDDDGIPR